VTLQKALAVTNHDGTLGLTVSHWRDSEQKNWKAPGEHRELIEKTVRDVCACFIKLNLLLE